MASDEELMGLVATGDAHAFETLCARYERPLHQFLWRHLGGRDVEDVHQETWLRVVRAAARFDPRRRFSTWLFQIAVNLCRDWHRSPPPEPRDPGGIDHGIADDPAVRSAAALDAARLLAALPEAQRAAVLLRWYHDLSEDEVAEILGVPRGTVKSRLHTAMTTLKALARRDA